MRLGKPGEVVKITVMAKQKIAVTVALTLKCRGNDGNAIGRQTGHLRGQLRTAFGVQVGVHVHVWCALGVRMEREFKSCKRLGVPTSAQMPVNNSALTWPRSIAALSKGASAQDWP